MIEDAERKTKRNQHPGAKADNSSDAKNVRHDALKKKNGAKAVYQSVTLNDGRSTNHARRK